MNTTKKVQTHRNRKQTSAYQCGERRRRCNVWVWDQEVQTVRYKISCKDILYNTGNMSVFYNNYNGV